MKKFQISLSIISCLITCNLLNVLVYVNGYSDSSSSSDTEAFSSIEYPGATLAIKALNPGYSIEGVQNVGEFIELVNLADDSSPLPLAGYTLRYTTKSGSSSDLYVFPESSQMSGKTLLLRLASSPQASQADLTYTKTLALDAGPLELLYNEKVIDSVCWTGSDACYKKFLNKSGSRTTLVQDLGTRSFTHIPIDDYSPSFDIDNPSYLPQPADEDVEPPEPIEPKCRGLEFSEIFTYYDVDKSEQFVELYNTSADLIDLSGCQIKYKDKPLPLSGSVSGNGYYTYSPDVAFTKNPTTKNNYELVDVTGDVIDTLILPHGQKKSTSYAQFGYYNNAENWLTTYSPTPGEANNYQQYRTCPEGKIINEETGNCIKATTIAEPQECPAGKYRNPLTGRCKSIEEDGVLAPCKEGYERNPETGRCRKIRDNDGASYPLVPTTATEKTSFIAGLAIAAVLTVGAAYILLQYRSEISRFIKTHLRKQPPNSPPNSNNK